MMIRSRVDLGQLVYLQDDLELAVMWAKLGAQVITHNSHALAS